MPQAEANAKFVNLLIVRGTGFRRPLLEPVGEDPLLFEMHETCLKSVFAERIEITDG